MNDNHSSLEQKRESQLKELEIQVAGIVAEITGHNVSDPKADLSALGLDSMALLDVLAVMEERFDVVLTEDVVQEFRTVHRIAHIIRDAIRSSMSMSK
jgi:acyl carrier protein